MSMFEKMKREVSAKKITAIILFGAICAVFVLFGMPNRLGAGVGAVGRVNNTLISLADFQQEEQRIQQYYASLFGGGMDFSSQRQLLRRQALENLVRTELGAQAARKEGILATDAEVRDFIVKEIPFFQQNGQFQRELYSRYLEATRSTPGDFENKVRKDIENIRSRRLFEIVGRPTTAEAGKLKALKETRLNIAFARLEQDQLLKQMNITEAEAQKALSDEAFAKRAQDTFNVNKADYEQKEEVHAQHILIAAKAGDKASEDQALQKIKALQKAAQADFGSVAQKNSEDPGSKVKKGDLGFFPRGSMVKEFEEVAFSLAPGKVSEPVKTQYGYHLIKVIEKRDARAANFDAQKVRVAQTILAHEKMDGILRNLDEALTRGDENKVNADLKSLGANWEETGFFEMAAESLPKIQSPAVRDSVNELSAQAPLLKRLVRDGNFKYVLKLKGTKTEPAATLASDSELVQKRRADGMYEAWVNDFRQASKVNMNMQVLEQN